MSKKNNNLFIQDGDNVIELLGAELEAFEANRKAMIDEQVLVETEYRNKQEARQDAIKKLAKIVGLTDEEIAAII